MFSLRQLLCRHTWVYRKAINGRYIEFCPKCGKYNLPKY